MFRKLLVIGILTLIGNSVFAQLDYGVKAGLNHVNVFRTDLPNFANFREFKQSYHLGGYVSLGLSKKLRAQAELLYSNKGYRYDETDISEKGHTNLNYINMPIMVRYQLFNRVSVNLGPELGYLISAYSREGDTKLDANGFWDNKFDLGAAVGLGINIRPNLILDFRYTHGLLTVAKDVIHPDNRRLTYLNHTFQLSLQFSLNK